MRIAATPEAYDRAVGRYARELAPRFSAFAGVAALPSGPVLDVGCGTGALTAWLAPRVGAAALSAIDPDERLAAVCRERVPGADVRVASAEAIPFGDRTFQASLAQLVLPFLEDAGRAAAEMARVVRPGGIVAACSFEAGGFTLVSTFWKAAARLDPSAPDDGRIPFRRAEELAALWAGAGLREIRTGAIDLDIDYDGFDELWSMFEDGVGPTGVYYLAQPGERRQAIREACLELLGRPARGFSLPARVVAVSGRV